MYNPAGADTGISRDDLSTTFAADVPAPLLWW